MTVVLDGLMASAEAHPVGQAVVLAGVIVVHRVAVIQVAEAVAVGVATRWGR
jgi:hypothetical protein